MIKLKDKDIFSFNHLSTMLSFSLLKLHKNLNTQYTNPYYILLNST